MSDPIDELTHDHGDLNRKVVSIAALLRTPTAQPDQHEELVIALADLRDQLFLHFAREEEGLFPFIANALPELAPQVETMSVAHDTICGALARTCHLAETNAEHTALVSLFERFQAAYADHASAESLVLKSLDRELGAAQREQLAALVAGI